VLQTDRADGTGYTTRLVSASPHPEVARGVEAVVRALDYTGVGDIEFMVDEAAGQVSFIELNPRLSASFRSAEVCGLPVSRLMLELGSGKAPAERGAPWDYPRGAPYGLDQGRPGGGETPAAGRRDGSRAGSAPDARLVRAACTRIT
jgi:hypothetical protein